MKRQGYHVAAEFYCVLLDFWSELPLGFSSSPFHGLLSCRKEVLSLYTDLFQQHESAGRELIPPALVSKYYFICFLQAWCSHLLLLIRSFIIASLSQSAKHLFPLPQTRVSVSSPGLLTKLVLSC